MSGRRCRISTSTSTDASTSIDTELAFSKARLRVSRSGLRSIISDLQSASPIALRPIDDEGRLSRVAIAQSSASLLAEDSVQLFVVVEPGAELELFEVSATIAYPSPSVGAADPIRQLLHVTVMDGATLILDEQPLIVAEGSELRRLTLLNLHAGARCLHRETLVLGRHGEQAGVASVRTRVLREGRPVLDDTLDTTAPLRALRSMAMLMDARCIASVGLWGWPPIGDPSAVTFAISDRDTVARRLGIDAPSALKPLDRLWDAWRDQLRAPVEDVVAE